jgi:hypothetical protein
MKTKMIFLVFAALVATALCDDADHDFESKDGIIQGS